MGHNVTDVIVESLNFKIHFIAIMLRLDYCQTIWSLFN